MHSQQGNDAFSNPLGLLGQDPSANAEAVEAHFKAQMKDMFDSIMHTAATYNTQAGKKELERMRKATIESAAWMPSLAREKGLEYANAHAYAREGQNALVRDIENRIELAKKVKTPEDLANMMMKGADHG